MTGKAGGLLGRVRVRSLRLLVRRVVVLRPFRAWCVLLWFAWGDAPGWYGLRRWRVGWGAGRRTPCAGRAVILTAVQSLRLLVRRVVVLRPFRAWCVMLWFAWGDAPCWYGLRRWRVGRGAGRRTPCAGRAVILTAVQSLRLLVRRRHDWTDLFAMAVALCFGGDRAGVELLWEGRSDDDAEGWVRGDEAADD